MFDVRVIAIKIMSYSIDPRQWYMPLLSFFKLPILVMNELVDGMVWSGNVKDAMIYSTSDHNCGSALIKVFESTCDPFSCKREEVVETAGGRRYRCCVSQILYL